MHVPSPKRQKKQMCYLHLHLNRYKTIFMLDFSKHVNPIPPQKKTGEKCSPANSGAPLLEGFLTAEFCGSLPPEGSQHRSPFKGNRKSRYFKKIALKVVAAAISL